MFSKRWHTSERKYGITVERNVSIPVGGGVTLSADIVRPDAPGKFPAICGFNIHRQDYQIAPIMPSGMTSENGGIEAGDSTFFVRRGYAHVIVAERGTGRSSGQYSNYAKEEQQDNYDVIEWVARQPWCDGNIGTFGPSCFAITALQVAALNPPHLKCIFAPWGYTDFYRHKFYHGGILAYSFTIRLSQRVPPLRCRSWTREKLGEEKFREAIAEALQDPEISSVPFLVDVLKEPEKSLHPVVVDMILNRFDGEYYRERSVKLENIKVPSYIGACWANFGIHQYGAFEAWERITAPKKMLIGPPYYLDRPVYQLQYESLRWFDHWLKGIENGIMDEPPIRLFVPGTGDWKIADEWPLPETKWTPFYLHSRGLLSEHEFFPNEGSSTFEDSPVCREGLTFLTPPLVENTEVIGPITLNLHASTTDEEVLWFASLLDIDPQGNERLLTRGWLRGSQREVDQAKSKLWEPFHPHQKREPLTPNKVYEFNINFVPTANLFKEGHRIGVRIKCVDDEKPRTYMETFSLGHMWRDSSARVTVYHNEDNPSSLVLPVTRGNIIGTYMSGGDVPPAIGKVIPSWLGVGKG